jgi:hypothetical protein
MRAYKSWVLLAALLGAASLGVSAQEADQDHAGPKCRDVRADLVEDRTDQGCEVPGTFCFIGQLHGNHHFKGTTRFKGDSGAAGPPTSPGFSSYSGKFEYFLDGGSLICRETGVTNTTRGNPESGAVTAFQKITSGTGDLEGATGYFFVSGFNIDNHVVTKVMGRICLP